MPETVSGPCTAFAGHRLLASGPLVDVALAVKAASDRGAGDPVLVFDDRTGGIIDLDLRGAEPEIRARLAAVLSPTDNGPVAQEAGPYDRPDVQAAEPRGRGRPRLGVVAREVTLLPRHWEWLAAEPGGASVALRRLVDEARRNGGARQRQRVAREAAYRFMSAMAGDFPGFEEATRALFASDRARFERQMAGWPDDVRSHALELASPGFAAESA